MNKLFKKGDILLTLLILVFCGALILIQRLSTNPLVATVYLDGETVKTINLDEVQNDYTFSPCKNVEIEVQKGKIRFSASECPDKLCVDSGWLETSGATTACLPEKVVITVESKTSDFDVITY